MAIKIVTQIAQDVISSANGFWSFRPQVSLSQGNMKMSISTTDKNGANVLLTRSFSIFPLGSQIAQSATPSATPIVIPVTVTPSATIPTASPTISTTTPPINSPSPTITQPLVTDVVSTNTPTIANPGGFGNTAALTSFSIILIILGAALLFAL